MVENREIEGWVAERYAREYFKEFVRSTHSRGARCFVFVANDDAMAPLIARGRRVFVDPDAEPGEDEKSRVALIESGGYYGLREESTDLGSIIYKPLASGFRTIASKDCRRIGYVVGVPEENWMTDE